MIESYEGDSIERQHILTVNVIRTVSKFGNENFK